MPTGGWSYKGTIVTGEKTPDGKMEKGNVTNSSGQTVDRGRTFDSIEDFKSYVDKKSK